MVYCYTLAPFDEEEAEDAMLRHMRRDGDLFHKLIEMARAYDRDGGDLAVLKFASNWYVGFVLPTEEMLEDAECGSPVPGMARGKTFETAARRALQRGHA